MRPLINLLAQTTIQRKDTEIYLLCGSKRKIIWNSWDKPPNVKNIIIEGKFESTLL